MYEAFCLLSAPHPISRAALRAGVTDRDTWKVSRRPPDPVVAGSQVGFKARSGGVGVARFSSVTRDAGVPGKQAPSPEWPRSWAGPRAPWAAVPAEGQTWESSRCSGSRAAPSAPGSAARSGGLGAVRAGGRRGVGQPRFFPLPRKAMWGKCS